MLGGDKVEDAGQLAAVPRGQHKGGADVVRKFARSAAEVCLENVALVHGVAVRLARVVNDDAGAFRRLGLYERVYPVPEKSGHGVAVV